MAAPAYRLRALRVELGAHPVLDIETLDIARGSSTAIVGPNGAGKTTLLRVLALLQAPTAGVVELDGRPAMFGERELAIQRRRVTFVAQSPLLFHRSVRANLAYGLRAHGVHGSRTEMDQRIAAALAMVGLARFGARAAWRLSGGETQRVAIARALAIDPAVYLFDEPTANVDQEHIAIIESVITRLGAAGKTVVLTTHNLEQAYRLTDAVLPLLHGRLAPFPLFNVLRGSARGVEGTQYFFTDGLRIEIADGSTPRAIAIDPKDIIVSREPLHSSARNSFAGRITKVERDGPGIALSINCGRTLVARITQHSYEELALNVGTPVYVTFKSSAIHVLDPVS